MRLSGLPISWISSTALVSSAVVWLTSCLSSAQARDRDYITHPPLASPTITIGPPVFDGWRHTTSEISVSVGDGMAASNMGEIGGYPRSRYLADAGLLVGAKVGAARLVSVGTDQRWPRYDMGDLGVEFMKFDPGRALSTRRRSPYYDPRATAEQQYEMTYTDTTHIPSIWGPALDETELRYHRPIGLEVKQTSYTWESPVARRFCIIDATITNISGRTLDHLALAYYADPDVGGGPSSVDSVLSQLDDICGFLPYAPGVLPGTIDTLNIAWVADNNGDPTGNYEAFDERGSPTGVFGLYVLRAPQIHSPSFNWFANDHRNIEWGPRRVGSEQGPSRSQGAPFGDVDRFLAMTNGEIDYDQLYSAIDMRSEGWFGPAQEQIAKDIADGLDTRMILSYGPLPDLAPGDSIQFTLALIIGSNLHRGPRTYLTYFRYDDPLPYIQHFDFRDLMAQARWANWAYDNPGVDTDGDGYAGEYYIGRCGSLGCDTLFYKGDGVPDFRGPNPPPAPELDILTSPGTVTIRWSGAETELYRDPLIRKMQFEGYRFYMGKFNDDSQYSLIASWDREDFRRYAYDQELGQWLPISDPMTIAQWQDFLAHPDFTPLDYRTPSFELAWKDTVADSVWNEDGEFVGLRLWERLSYWEKEEDNQGNEYFDGRVTYQNLIQQVGTRDTVIGGQVHRYGLYEIVLDKLNPTIPMFCSVTSLDFGDIRFNRAPLESSPSQNGRYVEFYHPASVVVDSGLKVSVYPNPYKVIYTSRHGERTTYFREGYEGRGLEEFHEQDRRIHFVNLPEKATIRIYSLDGDLIREIHHPDPNLTTYPTSVGWDLVSRNVQAVVSGTYIWRVDSELGTQMGKLVIIK